MSLSKEETDKWHHFYNRLSQFRDSYGHCNVPSAEEKYKELAKWVLIQKKAQHRLPAEFIHKLKSLGFDFAANGKSNWNEQYEELVKFFGKYGHAHVPATDPEYARLHDWLMAQIRNKDSLTENQKDKLDSLAINWQFNTLRAWKWHEMYLQLKKFYAKHGHCNVPQKWDKNPRLGHWVAVQRRRFAEKNLKKERRSKLEKMGFVWNFKEVYQNQWEEKFAQLLEFKKEHGHCKVPLTYENKQLAGWVDRQRTLKTNGRLSASREKKLSKIGFIWNCDVLQEEVWQSRFEELKEYRKKYGDCMVPVTWKKNPTLGTWVSTQRTLEKHGRLEEEKKEKLEKLGFVWAHDAWKVQLKKYDQRWEENYQNLKEYKEKYGEVQVSLTIDPSLQRWTCIQRKKRQVGKLSDKKIKKLNDIGFPWDIHESYWNRMYNQLVRFKQKFGHTRVPCRWEQNPRLGQWVLRTKLQQYELTKAQIALLNKINFDWHIIHKNPVPWTEMFDRLVGFKKTHGHTRVPVKWEKDKKLGKWVSRMRSDKHKLSPERKKMLENIGFDWHATANRFQREQPMQETSSVA